MLTKKNFSLKNFTTMAIGGPAKYFLVVKNETELLDALKFAKAKKLPWYVVGEGSNLVVNDRGFQGIIIQNKIPRFDLSPTLPRPGEGGRMAGRGRIVVGAGNNLLKTIFRLNRLGLAGMERMAGIPGTVGGAIYGCAGAYGQEIKDRLVSVQIWDGRKFRNLTKKQCRFGYRESIFKKNKKWIIIEAAFKFKNLDSVSLQRRASGAGMTKSRLMEISRDIIKLREKKYKPGLKCPGSFFKNIKISDIQPATLRQKFVKKIPSARIMYGKVAAGYLLEQVHAKGLRQGDIRVAAHHANLIYNPNGGKSADVRKLARKMKKMIKAKFGIKIEEEVQYL